MTWNFNMDEAPRFTDLFVATKDNCVICDWRRGTGKWASSNVNMLLAWRPIEKPVHPDDASDAKSVQSNPTVQPGNS